MPRFVFANPQSNGLPPCPDCMELYDEAMFCEKHHAESETERNTLGTMTEEDTQDARDAMPDGYWRVVNGETREGDLRWDTYGHRWSPIGEVGVPVKKFTRPIVRFLTPTE